VLCQVPSIPQDHLRWLPVLLHNRYPHRCFLIRRRPFVFDLREGSWDVRGELRMIWCQPEIGEQQRFATRFGTFPVGLDCHKDRINLRQRCWITRL
jgi:hypothetical protein